MRSGTDQVYKNRVASLRQSPIDDADAILHAEHAVARDMILAPDDGHLVLTAEGGNVDKKLPDQNLLERAATFEHHAPFPFTARRLIGHRVVTVADEFRHRRSIKQLSGAKSASKKLTQELMQRRLVSSFGKLVSENVVSEDVVSEDVVRKTCFGKRLASENLGIATVINPAYPVHFAAAEEQ